MHKANFWTLQNHPLENLFVKKVKNCVVTRSLLVMTAKGVARSCLYENLQLKKKVQMNVVGAASVLKNKLHFPEGDKKYFFIFNPWSYGYYHWLTEIAVKLLLFRDELLEGTIVLPSNPPHFVTDFLELFGFNNVETLRDNVFFKELNVITNPHTNHYHKDHLFLLRNQVLDKVGNEGNRVHRKLYVSRKFARARKVVNEEELTDYLTSQGFECFYLDNTAFVEQVKLFRSCETLVSIHGAALTNSLFMPSGGNVIELYPKITSKENDFSACYYRLCTVLGHKHSFLFSDRSIAEKKFRLDTGDLVVDLPALDKSIKSTVVK